MKCQFFFQYELLFCVEEESDPAVMVVRSLLEKYPSADARLFTGDAFDYSVDDPVKGIFQACRWSLK